MCVCVWERVYVCLPPSLELAEQVLGTGARHLALLHLDLPARELRIACPLSHWRAYFASQYSLNNQQNTADTKGGVVGFSHIYSELYIKIWALIRELCLGLLFLSSSFPSIPSFPFRNPVTRGPWRLQLLPPSPEWSRLSSWPCKCILSNLVQE